MKATRTEYDGVYMVGREHVASRQENGEWQLHRATIDEFFSYNDTWCETYRTLRQLKEEVEEWEK